MIAALMTVLTIAYLIAIPVLLYAILITMKAGFNEVIKGLETISEKLDQHDPR